MNQTFSVVNLTMELVVPHHYISLAGDEFLPELVENLAAGRLPAELNISLGGAQSANAVHPVILELWRKRLAAKPALVEQIRDELGDAVLDEAKRLEESFWAWSIGTPVIEVNQWLKAVASTKKKKGEK